MHVQCKENAGFFNQQNEATLAGFSAKTHWNQVIKCFRCNYCTKSDAYTILNYCYHEKPMCNIFFYNVLRIQSAIMFMCSVYNATIP